MLKSCVRSTLSLKSTLPACPCAFGVSVKALLDGSKLADPLTVTCWSIVVTSKRLPS